MLTFLSYFVILITEYQHTIIISYTLLTSNILIIFYPALYNPKYLTFLLISSHIVSKSFLFCFTFGLANSLSNSVLCFLLLLLTHVSLLGLCLVIHTALGTTFYLSETSLWLFFSQEIIYMSFLWTRLLSYYMAWSFLKECIPYCHVHSCSKLQIFPLPYS